MAAMWDWIQSSAARAWPVMMALFLLAPTAWGQALNHDAPSDALVNGVFHVKVSESAKSGISLSNAGDVAQMGISSIDALSAQFDAQRIERMFPTDQRHAERHAKWGLDRWYRVYLAEDAESITRSAVSAFHSDANVEMADHVLQKQQVGTRVERTERVHSLIESVEQGQLDVTNDPLYGDQWHFNNTGQTGGTPDADIDLPEAHDIEMGSSDVIVQVIDSGIELDHPDMQGSYWINPNEEEDGTDTDGNGYVDDIYGYNFADGTASPEIVDPAVESNSHGLHVSGTIAARNNNNEGVASVAGGDGTADSGVRIMTGLTFGSNVTGFAEALIYGADNGAIISNNSWGYTSPGVFEQPVLDAIDYFVAEAGGPDAPMDGGIVVVAAGNSNSDDEWYPGYYEPAFTVAGTQHNDDKYSGSNFGDWVDISAPTGEAFSHPTISTLHTQQGTYGGDVWVGTSMAAPHVAGAAALIASNQPGFTAEQVQSRLVATGDETIASEPIGPRVNAFAALSAEDTPPDPITDLAVVTPNNITPGAVVNLQWTATGEAGSEGTATGYDLRYSTDGPIDSEAAFDAATPIEGLPAPQEAGEPESFTAEGLPFEEEVHFSIKAIDALGNRSDLSNSPSAETGPAPELAFSPASVDASLEINSTTTTSLTVENTGSAGSTLEYSFPSIAAQNLLSQSGIETNDTSSLGLARNFSKGEDPNAGAGHPVLLGAGGPDEFGYRWIDSNEPGGPSFNWTDITDEGTSVTLGDDDSETVSLPFSFDFYGETKEEVTIGSNGYLTFGAEGTDFSNDQIPSTSEPNDFIAPFWDDLNPSGGGSVHYLADGDQFIVQYTDIPPFALGETSDSYTFQVILTADDGVRYQYLSMDGAVNEATVGTENADGLDGLQVAFNTSYVEDGLAVDIAAVPDFIADVSPASGSLSSGSSDDITVTLDATGVDAGDYENTLPLASNDPNAATSVIPFSVSVTAGPPEIAVDPAEIAFDPVLENGESTAFFTVNNTGGEDLEITSIESDSDQFAVDVETPITIAFDDAPASIPVTFAPTSVGTFDAEVTIASNADNAPEATVAVSGEGLEAPEIGVDPEAFDVTVDLGSTIERTLSVSNTGGNALEYEAVFSANGEDTEPSAVAAPFAGSANSVSADAFQTSGSARPTGQQPYQASDYIYQVDDGSSEDAIGLTDGGDVMWMNAFEVVDGATTITSIASAWGASGQEGVPEGRPAEFLIYEDPNDDGDPSDAVLLDRVEVTVESPHTDEFTEASIAPTQVEGVFFIAALYADQQGGANAEFPAPQDQDTSQGASWIIGSTTPNSFDAEDLGANDVPPANVDDVDLPGNWLLRADAGAPIVAVAPNEGTVEPGGSQDLTVTFDGTASDPGNYEGNISLFSNDFANSPLDVPVELFIDAGPPQIVLDPRTLEFDESLVGSTSTLAFEVTNLGSDTLEVANITSAAGDFTPLTTSAGPLAYNETAEIEVEFTPSETGVRVGTIAIESNAENKPTAEVAVVGEGLAAPSIAADPESFDVTVPFEETLEETLLVSNAGEGELEYEVNVAAGASNLSPSAVAAPFESEMEQPTVDSPVKAARTPGTSSGPPAPYQASEFVYQLDDGSSENALGAGGGEIMWINAFETVEGSATINSIASAWAAGGEEGFPEGGEAEFLLYNDPNNDGNPSDAELLTSVGTTVQAPHTDEFTVEEIAPTQVEGVFFIAAVVGYEDGQFPAPIDESSSQGSSWIVGGGTVDTGDLSNNDLGPDNLDSIGFPGNWLLRADAIEQTEPGVRPLPADAVTIEPREGTVTPGGEQELAVTFDGNIDPGQYTGSIRILNNDPLQSVLDVPVDMLVDAGPPEVALDPESLTFDGTLVGASRTLTFEISNAGGNPLIIESVTSDSGDFTVEEDLAFVVRQDTVDVSVTFAPTAVGSRSGAITLQTNIGEDETVTVPVEGEGLVPPALALNPDVLQNVQQTNTQEDVPLTISNDEDSGSTLNYSFPAFAAQNVLSQPGVERNNTSSVVNGTRSFEKGDADPHAGQGHPVQLGAGGPDGFGYRWIDSNEFGGPSFEWVDISENENAVALDLTDDFLGTPSVEVDLPFEFDFYGEAKTSVRVDNNGFLFFDSPSGNYFINQEIPTPGAPNGIVAPFWVDLNPGAGGDVYVYDDSENNRFIVQYNEVPPFAFGETEDAYTFQIILTAEGMIRYQYLDMDGPTSGATVGVENADGSDGLQVAFGTDYIENNLAVDIAFVPQFITDVEPASGSIGSGESESVQVTFDSEGLDVGVYGQEGRFGLGVSTNDPRATFGYTPAVLSVVGENGPTIADAPADQELILGGAPFEVDLSTVFTDPIGDGLEYSIEASNPALVDAALEGSTLTVTPTGAGISTVSIAASNADGEARAEFAATVGQLAVDVNRDFGGQAADATNYRLVALPGDISLPMSDIVEGEAGLDWQAYWDSGSEGLVQFDGSETFAFEPGRGFWLTGQSAWEYQSEHTAIELDRPDGRVAVPLHDGWNIVSNPMGIDLDWAAVEALNEGSFQPIWAFNGAFSEAETLGSAMSGEAYYFLNDGGLNELVLQAGEEQPEPPSETPGVTTPDTDPLISMAATLVDRPDVTSTVQLGVTESSVTAAPLVGPPSAFEAVSLRIQPDANQVAASEETRSPLMRSQRTMSGEGETFTLTLRTQAEGPVEIRFSDLTALNGREAALLHPSAGTTYDLSTNSTVTLEPDSDEITLRVAIGTQAFVDGAVDEVLPTELTLTAYPNPVQSQATVQYTLTEAEDVRFEVYDMLGRRVATLTNERKQAGVHEVPFDASQLASGVYFGRLHVGGQTLTQKITVVR